MTFENNDDEDEHYKKKTIKKSKKINIEGGCVLSKLFNDSHFTKECKLLMKFCWICKASDHNTNQCPSKAMSGSCPSKEIVLAFNLHFYVIFNWKLLKQ